MKKAFKSIGSMLLAGTLLCSTGCFLFPEEKATYVVTFVQEGCENITFEVQEGGSIANVPKPQDKVGYTTGWDKSDFSNITSDMTVTAISRANEYTITYRAYDPMDNPMTLEGGTTQKVTYDSAYELQALDFYGYAFNGWMNGTELLAQSGTWQIASNVTLSPSWSNNYYTITFIQEDGSSVDCIVENGDVLTDIPAITPVDGYDVAWSVTDFSTITQNTTVSVVKMAKSYNVVYQLADGESVDGELTQSFVYGQAYQLKTPTKAGYNFVCWKLEDGTALPIEGDAWKQAKDVTLVAEWTANDNEITFIHADGSTETRFVQTGSVLTDVPTPKPVEGYEVVWDVTDFSGITEATTVNAKLTAKQYTVTYSLAADEALDETTTTVTYDAAYTLATPTKYAYTFAGWQTADGKVIPVTGDAWKIANDEGITLTAKWQDNFYTVVFNNTDGTSTKVIVEKGDALAADKIPACKTATGYNCSWSVTDFSSITSDMTVNVVKVAKTYTIKYMFATGSESLPAGVAQEFTVTYGEQYQLATPTHKNVDMKFVGWKDASGKTIELSGTWLTDASGVIELRATWNETNDWTQNY